jgi:methionyl-tRNA formyltransferase
MKIAFFGTSDFGIPTLNKLHTKFGVEILFTGIPRPAHRGQKLKNTPIFDEAQKLGIHKLFTPEKLLPEHADFLHEIDYAIVVAYGLILPEFILKAVRKKCFNIHPSKLPLFRGAAPIERTIEAGYSETEICVIEMTKALDAGNIVAKEGYKISPQENSIILHEKFAEIGADLTLNLLENDCKNALNIVQNHESATYAKKITKAELEILQQENLPANIVMNKIRAFASYGYCYILYNQKRIKIIEAIISQTKLTEYDISCVDGFISPTIIRPEGKSNIVLQ